MMSSSASAAASRRVLTLGFVFRRLLSEVLHQHGCVRAPGLALLRQLVQQLHRPAGHFERRHRLVAQQRAEPAVHLHVGDNETPGGHGGQHTYPEHYLVNLFTHAVQGRAGKREDKLVK